MITDKDRIRTYVFILGLNHQVIKRLKMVIDKSTPNEDVQYLIDECADFVKQSTELLKSIKE